MVLNLTLRAQTKVDDKNEDDRLNVREKPANILTVPHTCAVVIS